MKDTVLAKLVTKEQKRQLEGIELIPSENYASSYVRSFLSTVLVNKYSEGYPGKRYYGGNEVVDDVERLAQERAKKLFKVAHVNVQPYSGSPANFAVYIATCKPGDTIMGQALTAGGHLTHGHNVSASGIFFNSVQYGVHSWTGDPTGGGPKRSKHARLGTRERHAPSFVSYDLFDYDEIRRLALKHKPKLIWVGATAHPLKFDYKKFAKIADEVGAYLAADIAHVAGLIAGGVHPSPVPDVHIVTTTTHKTLRGPRGAMIMVTEKGIKHDPELPKKIDKAVFPGLQGGPHDNQTAAIAAALWEASTSQFKTYAKQVVKNAKTLADTLQKGGLDIVAGRTENHLILVDLTKTHGRGTGIFAERALNAVGLVLNKNTVPGETSTPFYPSGIRLGTPVATTREMKEKEMKQIGNVIIKVLHETIGVSLAATKEERISNMIKFTSAISQNKKLKELRKEVKDLALKFPISL